MTDVADDRKQIDSIVLNLMLDASQRGLSLIYDIGRCHAAGLAKVKEQAEKERQSWESQPKV